MAAGAARRREAGHLATPRAGGSRVGPAEPPAEAHRPLGNIMRVRKEIYRQSSLLRHEKNHQVRKEPKNVAEVFGEEMAAVS